MMRYKTCPTCGGTGVAKGFGSKTSESESECPRCDGTGKIPEDED